jgi:hypothetical protein
MVTLEQVPARNEEDTQRATRWMAVEAGQRVNERVKAQVGAQQGTKEVRGAISPDFE